MRCSLCWAQSMSQVSGRAGSTKGAINMSSWNGSFDAKRIVQTTSTTAHTIQASQTQSSWARERARASGSMAARLMRGAQSLPRAQSEDLGGLAAVAAVAELGEEAALGVAQGELEGAGEAREGFLGAARGPGQAGARGVGLCVLGQLAC